MTLTLDKLDNHQLRRPNSPCSRTSECRMREKRSRSELPLQRYQGRWKGEACPGPPTSETGPTEPRHKHASALPPEVTGQDQGRFWTWRSRRGRVGPATLRSRTHLVKTYLPQTSRPGPGRPSRSPERTARPGRSDPRPGPGVALRRRR